MRLGKPYESIKIHPATVQEGWHSKKYIINTYNIDTIDYSGFGSGIGFY